MTDIVTGWEPLTFIIAPQGSYAQGTTLMGMQEVFTWCKEQNIVYYFDTHFAPDLGSVCTMSFDHEKDAIIFKLAWSQIIYTP